MGDYDDILALTVRSRSSQEPFRGSWLNRATNQRETVTSTMAEVLWYAYEDREGTSEPGMRNVYRRTILVAPWVDLSDVPLSGIDAFNDIMTYYADNDISARIENGKLVANSLGDLTKRENRFAHYYDPNQPGRGFPHPIINPIPLYQSGVRDRLSEDRMLSDVLAFDVRVYDPGAPLRLVAGSVVEPSDAGWSPPTSHAEIVGYGAFVDLNWSGYNAPPDAPKPQFAFPTGSSGDAYDTWSYHYEHDGIDQDGDGMVDEGANGLDDDGVNGVDDEGEREALPPYAVPLRGLQVTFRTYDRDTRQVRQATIKHSLVP